MGKVFISYSRRDKEVVKQIVTQLKVANIQAKIRYDWVTVSQQ
jgi:hypothetical protein